MDVVVQKHPALYASDQGAEFLTFAPYSLSAKEQIKKAIFSKRYPREELSSILEKYNALIENDSITRANCQRLTDPSTVCVVTSQPPGLMGGPAYAILKGISCLLLARELNALPVYWLSTEEESHSDWNCTYLIDSLGNLKEYRLNVPKKGQAEDLVLTRDQIAMINQVAEEAKVSVSFKMREDFITTTAGFLAKLFQGTGLIFVDPKWLRSLSRPFWYKELRHHRAILNALQGSRDRLLTRGQTPSLATKRGPQLVFKELSGNWHQILEGENGFKIGERDYSLSELEAFIEKSPERFGTTCASRPVLQSAIFPTAAYVAGPNEITYYHQLQEYHDFHDVPMPWIVPRLTGTFLTPQASQFLSKLSLEPWDKIPKRWNELMPELQNDLHKLKGEWEHSALRLFSEELTRKTLDRYLKPFLKGLERRLIKERLSKQETPLYTLHYLRNLIQPHRQLQERVLNWAAFQSTCHKNLINECMHVLKWDISGHFYFAI
ncbi:MAG: bacillithiol biosynthesis protein BshC [Parachlamydiaceae bacterium]